MSEGGKLKNSPLVFVVAGAILSYVVYTQIMLYLARKRMMKDHGCKPCKAIYNKDPIFGLDVLRSNTKNAKEHKILERNLERLHELDCKTFRSRLVNQPIIVTVEPENIKTVLSLKFKDYSIGHRGQAFTPLLGHGIFTTDGDRWANSRHLLRPNFARDQVADLSMLERHFKLLLKVIPKDGATVDLQELFFRMTIDSATEFLFNHSTNSLRMVGQRDQVANEDDIFARAFQTAQDDITVRTRLGFLSYFRKNKEADEANRICHEYVDKWVDEAVRWREGRDRDAEKADAKVDERYVFIHELAKQTKDKKQIRDELINILLAGRDTTASLLSNMFVYIAKDPRIWAKLREEVAPLEGRLPTYEELRSFKYVKWCLNESLRVNPVVPANSRLATRDTVLPLGGGPDGTSSLFVPAGTIVAYSLYSMHRRTDYYGADAEVFRPERWEHLRPGWEYLPFNGGPRICLGQQYALTEAGYVLVRMVQEFAELESRDQGPWEESLTLTLCSRNGTMVGLKR
ncbi:cytochrome P450 [Aaosphaeria arxii CBS 175.79]|uniref:Cytochrome P450 n=1 Tax=Aaosphaeria arxii CBS 175.79 TaxID=1450172 RepID=A0A6A5Y2L6_9PLEO|nr:cytochrome P450 [Aaosphaeria arxii CBS 175.79]KAF2019698.1 cytochrome P450 [Aaosphaeria arxii CBS 175.79]